MTDKLVYSAVAIPGEPDYDGEILTESEIQYAAHKFMSDYRVIDPEHVCALTNECINVGTPVESTILKRPMTVKAIHGGNDMTLPKGSWILGIEITDPNEWNRIVTGEATGLSLTAGRTTLKSRVLIRDLGKNWEVRTVSIVKDPAVPKAKFFQIGSGMMNDEATKSRLQGFFDKIEEAVKNFKQEETSAEPITEEETVEVEPAEEVEAVKSEEETTEEETEEELVAEPEETSEEPQQEEVVETEEQVEDAVKFVTAEDLEKTKEDILEAVKTLMQPGKEDEAVKAEDTSEEATEDDEDLDEIRKKDLKIAELEKKIFDLEAKLKSATKSRSKGIPPHFEGGKVVKNLYEDDGRDLYGRVIR
jgi:hypothetical protein